MINYVEPYPGNWSAAITQRIGRWNRTRYELRLRALTNLATEATLAMRVNAAWQNHTWQARRSLEVTVRAFPFYPAGGRNEIEMHWRHGVFYGKYLEHRYGGKYAIVGPTFRQYASRVRAALRRPQEYA